MSKTEEKTLLSQNWAHKMFYVILPAYFKELQKYQNLQFLVKTSPKITFYIVREYYIITIYIFTMEIYHNMQYEINGWLLHRFMRTPLFMFNYLSGEKDASSGIALEFKWPVNVWRLLPLNASINRIILPFVEIKIVLPSGLNLRPVHSMSFSTKIK